MTSLLKKLALIFPQVRSIRDDLHNRRRAAEEYSSDNALLVEQLDVMKSEMQEALDLKKAAIDAHSDLSAKADHLQQQLSNKTERYERSKEKIAKLEAQICHYQLENDALIRKIAARNAA